ncbi:CRISPR-associated endonuclease Cas2 [Eggerthellaceae bacterium 3-80]
MINKSGKQRYDAMWCVVMFDLPVQTKIQRREASKFRKPLQDNGFSMIQFSVYGKYSPTYNGNIPTEKIIKDGLPADGEVRILHLTDAQWAKVVRFISKKKQPVEEKYEQLVLF